MVTNLKFSLKTPLNLSYWWNLGSLLLFLVIIQIISGIFLTFYYENSENAFYAIWSLNLNVNKGFFFHYLHLNFSSFIFLFMYLHMFKGLIYSSFLSHKILWSSGFFLMVMMMMISFLGYVLPWGQMSLWGATVITNLMSVIPFGEYLVEWIWGGYFVSLYTLKLFYSLHYLTPFVMLSFTVVHIILLHMNGSSNPLGGFTNFKTEFLPLYLYKDFLNILLLSFLLFSSLTMPYLFSDPENFLPSDLMISPIHIQPEWYFLNYYCMLRAIPNKVGGVMVFLLSMMMILLLTYFKYIVSFQSYKSWWSFCSSFMSINLMLIWLGGCPVTNPFSSLSMIFTLTYYLWFFILFSIMYYWKNEI